MTSHLASAEMQKAFNLDEPMQLLVVVMPVMPKTAVNARVKERVTATFTVGEDGSVSSVSVPDSANPNLAREVVRALKKWRFKPFRRAGALVKEQRASISFNFEVAH